MALPLGRVGPQSWLYYPWLGPSCLNFWLYMHSSFISKRGIQKAKKRKEKHCSCSAMLAVLQGRKRPWRDWWGGVKTTFGPILVLSFFVLLLEPWHDIEMTMLLSCKEFVWRIADPNIPLKKNLSRNMHMCVNFYKIQMDPPPIYLNGI